MNIAPTMKFQGFFFLSFYKAARDYKATSLNQHSGINSSQSDLVNFEMEAHKDGSKKLFFRNLNFRPKQGIRANTWISIFLLLHTIFPIIHYFLMMMLLSNNIFSCYYIPGMVLFIYIFSFTAHNNSEIGAVIFMLQSRRLSQRG